MGIFMDTDNWNNIRIENGNGTSVKERRKTTDSGLLEHLYTYRKMCIFHDAKDLIGSCCKILCMIHVPWSTIPLGVLYIYLIYIWII